MVVKPLHAALLLALSACSAKAQTAIAPAPAPPSGVADASAAPIASAAPPPPAIPDEPPLAWGTRPDKAGPLYPIVDGMCIHMEVWPFDDGGAYVTYGNLGGGYNRGSLNPTGTRIVDAGLDLAAKSYSPLNPVMLEGRWDGLVVAYTNLPSRMGLGDTAVVTHDANGWKTVAESSDAHADAAPGGAGAPYVFSRPVVFQGHVVYAKLTLTSSGGWTMALQATPPLAGLAALNGAVSGQEDLSLAASDDALYVSYGDGKNAPAFREWRAGKVSDVLPPGAKYPPRILATKPALVVVSDKVWELAGGAYAEIPLPAGPPITTMEAAPTGDLWFAQRSHATVLVARAGADGHHSKIDTLPLPAPAVARPEDEKLWSAVAGADLAGVRFDDVYAVGRAGTLFHREGDAWKEVPFPKPPWATHGYRAETIAMKAKGDLFVNASYAEKGAGWKTPERYRAILRTKRPEETLRCNEPSYGDSSSSGAGFMSFPPLADDACTTPFVVILRTWYAGVDAYRREVRLYDAKSDLPSVRASIKATPSLGETVDLVDLRAGNQGYLGAAVPSVAAGRAFITELAKRVTVLPELRPELVCGSPTHVVSTRKVTVASGAWAPKGPAKP